ncbi:MAG: sigma-54 interaction domain-containing protein [Guyparkeria sp.]|uniref:sigma-54 interaction domain-containing protein n=1 Tax=Guyparkeria sp. TaxID=2035736 RepID=UPI00397B829B
MTGNRYLEALRTQSPRFESTLRSIGLVAGTDATVLITGETGTGKELAARAIHEGSSRRGGPMVTVNCATIPDDLAESTLFGHRRGAFTGALNDQQGLVDQADGGTLFLDELGELPTAMQAKLLRLLENGETRAVGEAGTRRVDLRIVAATHRDLESMVEQGTFRADLYYRLSGVPIELLPLRDRQGDAEWLFRQFLEDNARGNGVAVPRLTARATGVLRRYRWPGNVRELRQLAERLVIFHAGTVVDVEALPPAMRSADQSGRGGPIAPGFVLPEGGVDLEAVESDLLRQALVLTGGNKSRAARLLNLSRDTFLYRLKKFAIE